MRRQIRLVAPAVVPVLLATLAVAVPVPVASAADECIAAPTSEAPAGSSWHYRTDRATQRKCWFLSQNGRKVGATGSARARDGATADTVGDGQSASPPGAAPGSADDALTRRECDIELSVLNYRKLMAGVFQAEAQGSDVDARIGELAAKQCRKPGS